MKVLLISPLDPKRPTDIRLLMGGESTYTKMLLAFPPRGIEWIYINEALKNGLVSLNVYHYFFLGLQKLRLLPPGPRIMSINIHKSFDLIYAHAHPIRVSGNTIPVVISDSSSNTVFLEKYLHWSNWRIKFSQTIKTISYRLFKIIDPEVNPAKHLFVFSKWAKEIKKKAFHIRNCRVIYPGLPTPRAFTRTLSKSVSILFVGAWFERKGGRIILDAFEKLQRKYHDLIHLTIIGKLPSDISIYRYRNISHKNFVTYRELLAAYQSHDVLVHVPPEVEGYGMTVSEAMSYGLIPVVSRVCALPEFIEDGVNGMIVDPGSVTDLEKTLDILMKDRRLRQKISTAAHLRFQKQFSLPVFQKELLHVFYSALR